MLNTSLTVRQGQPNSHSKKGYAHFGFYTFIFTFEFSWETFTDAVIKEIDKRADGVVFLLWGKPAQQK